ncbi:siderophore-interacting protein [Xenorhabdus sp. XENO-10]|uniref:Siderophore-interacting protein n=2 Tax=Xenorhabdus yunnanensis TaxID=3025878 RepID=A0ABT5LGF6_9GAMM|nr:siderophore-interacting protein [Xenorhabdus yunnanensis]MDC9590183.1 siderophore-interacting protein [Xenorhabdus yunnanensis]
MLRCVFEGSEVHKRRRYAPDQRIKLLFPQQNNPSLQVKEEKELKMEIRLTIFTLGLQQNHLL